MKNFTFKKHEKILGNDDYKALFSNGINVTGRFLRLYKLENNCHIRKIGIAITKKIKSKPVKNRYKRLIREVYRTNKDQFLNNCNYVMYVFKAIENVNFQLLQDDLILCINKMNGSTILNEKDTHKDVSNLSQ